MLKTLVFVLLAACGGSDVCEGDHCVCAANDDCTHDCTTGGNTCEVQCAPGHDCDHAVPSPRPTNLNNLSVARLRRSRRSAHPHGLPV